MRWFGRTSGLALASAAAVEAAFCPNEEADKERAAMSRGKARALRGVRFIGSSRRPLSPAEGISSPPDDDSSRGNPRRGGASLRASPPDAAALLGGARR